MDAFKRTFPLTHWLCATVVANPSRALLNILTCESARKRIVSCQQVLFALMLALIGWAAIFLYINRSVTLSEMPIPERADSRIDIVYFFLRAAARINRLVNYSVGPAVSTDAVARNPWLERIRVGMEGASLLSVVGVTVVIAGLMRMLTVSQARREWFQLISILTALIVPPISYFAFGKLEFRITGPPFPLLFNPLMSIFIAEIVAIAILSFIHSKRPLGGWTLCALLMLHYGFWLSVLWGQGLITTSITRLILVPVLFMLAFPLSAILWLIRNRFPPSRQDNINEKAWRIAGAVSVIVLGLIWVPMPGRRLARSNNLSTVTIELRRGPCYGICGTYRLAIRGNGEVEYDGSQRDRRYPRNRIRVHQTGSISREQVVQILERLDSVHFSTLDDAAFLWCFDTPSVSVAVSLDGQTNKVVSDSMCVGPKAGPQDRFVRAAAEIEKMVTPLLRSQ